MAEAEETKSLWRQFSTNKDDKALRDRLILTYAPLVKYVAGRLGSGLPAHVDEGDLVSYGLLGLIGAIERYDPERDVKFETYAIASSEKRAPSAGFWLTAKEIPERPRLQSSQPRGVAQLVERRSPKP